MVVPVCIGIETIKINIADFLLAEEGNPLPFSTLCYKFFTDHDYEIEEGRLIEPALKELEEDGLIRKETIPYGSTTTTAYSLI
jgi:hypothetical protein